MVLGATIVDYFLPSKMDPTKEFSVAMIVDVTGVTGDSGYVFAGVYDEDVMGIIISGVSDVVEPGDRVRFTGTLPPMVDWYQEITGRPIPETLRWSVIAGRATAPPEWTVDEVTDQTGVIEIPVVWPRKIPPWLTTVAIGGSLAAVGVVLVGKKRGLF